MTMKFDDRLAVAIILTFMALSGIFAGVMAFLSSPYEKEVVVPIIFVVTLGISVPTMIAWLKLNQPKSKFWKC